MPMPDGFDKKDLEGYDSSRRKGIGKGGGRRTRRRSGRRGSSRKRRGTRRR